jgi:hypothetical protein
MFKCQEYISIQHIIGPLYYFHGGKDMLIDVRTGKEVRILGLNPMILSWIRPMLLPGMCPANNLDDPEPTPINDITEILGLTCIKYVNPGIKRTSAFEYAQI